jgi:hypothetical protein
MKRILLFGFSYIALYHFCQAQNADTRLTPSNYSDSSEVRKISSKKNVIRLYPNPSYGKVSVSANTAKALHFYIFDLEGTLVYQAILSNKEKKSIDNLKKGTYIYDVFEKDLSIEEGKIIIK